MLIDPSTVNVIPVQTWAVVIVKSPEITPPWSQGPARAAGLTDTIAAKIPPRAMDQTIKRLSALPFRRARFDIRSPPKIEPSRTSARLRPVGMLRDPCRPGL